MCIYIYMYMYIYIYIYMYIYIYIYIYFITYTIINGQFTIALYCIVQYRTVLHSIA